MSNTPLYLLNHLHSHAQISEGIKQARYKHFTQIGISSLLSGNMFKIQDFDHNSYESLSANIVK